MVWWPPVRVTVADRASIYAETLPRHIALSCFAALSTDPFTVDELLAATTRYQLGRPFPWQPAAAISGTSPLWLEAAQPPPTPPHTGSPSDARQTLIIHLPSRTIGSDTAFPTRGSVPLILDGKPDSKMLLYGLRDDWLIVPPEAFPEALADAARSDAVEAAFQEQLAARQALYGGPAEWLAQLPLDDGPRRAADLHRRWLTTPRDELGGRTPRQALFHQFAHVDRDLNYQQHNWMVTGTAPPGLPETSRAFAAAPFGRCEIFVYHLMTRNVISYFLTNRSRRGSDSSARRRDKLVAELTAFQTLWQSKPLRYHNHWVPNSITATERRRIPPTADAERIAQCQCEICQTLARHAPLFWHLEFSPLEDEFLYSFCATEEEWQTQRQQVEEDERIRARRRRLRRFPSEWPHDD